jgi:hypothetical protein
MSHDDKLSGTLLVNCSSSACRRVIQESKKMEGVTFVFRVDKKSQKDPDVIIDVSGGKDLIQKVENNIRKIVGVHSVNHEIEKALNTKNTNYIEQFWTIYACDRRTI